jgi:hypothetical protein
MSLMSARPAKVSGYVRISRSSTRVKRATRLTQYRPNERPATTPAMMVPFWLCIVLDFSLRFESRPGLYIV